MDRELAEIKRILQRMENLMERFVPFVDELEKELKLVRSLLERNDRREEIKEARRAEETRKF